MQTPFSAAAVAAIRAYQRWVSPRKGWRCAHAAVTGGASCSTVALDAVQKLPLHRAWAAVRAQLATCAASAESFSSGGSSASEAGGDQTEANKRGAGVCRHGDDSCYACMLPFEAMHCCGSFGW